VGLHWQPPRGCWELARQVYWDLKGERLDDYASAEATPERLAELIDAEVCAWTPVRREQALDLILFRIAGHAMHIGIITEPGYFLHAQSGEASRIERYQSPKWARRIEGIYRHGAD
jgi:cell wall-associated NlpC family hydrolase